MTATVALRPLVVTELRLQRRHGVLLTTVVMTAMWVVVLLALPAPWRPRVLPWVLFLDLATLGFFFVPALAVVERANGVTAALRVTRLGPTRALAVRLSVLSLSAVAAALVVVPVAGLGWSPPVLTGVVLTTGLLSLLAVVMIGRADTLTTYVARVPTVAVPLLVPALVRGTGLWDSAVLTLSPATGALELLAGRWSAPTFLWILLWLAALWVVATTSRFDVGPDPTTGRPSAPSTPRVTPLTGVGPLRALRSFAIVDRRTLLGDRLLLLLVAGVPLVALAVRWLQGPGRAWLQGRYGVDVSPHLPAVWALALVVHTAAMFGAVAGLLFLEDRDAGVLAPIATTRASLPALLAYRLGATALATAGFVVVGLRLAGAEHPAGIVGELLTAVAAGAVAVIPAILLACTAHDRVQGMALMKAMGLPLYLPVAWWYVQDPAGWLFAILPTAWAARALWSTSAPTAFGSAMVAVALSSTVAAGLIARWRRSLLG